MDEPLINSAGSADVETAKRALGRPFPKGVSGNPRGRPRKASALAEAIRERVPPETLIGVALTVMRDGASRDKIAAAQLLATFGWTRPEQRHELVMGTNDPEEDDLTRCTLDELHELEALERRRTQILEAAAARSALPTGEP